MNIKPIILLLLFSAIAFPCNGSASILVPAVVGDGSSLVNLSVRLIPGNTDVFVSTFPQTGTSTQTSVEDAAVYAFYKAGTKDCDAIVKIDTSGSAGYVEGPSAGAALTVVTYSAAKNIEPRGDAIITGSVDSLGNIGKVGGLYEKAMAAAAKGADYFIIPRSSFLDLLLLKNAKEKYDLEVLEAKHVDDVIGFMLDNKSLPEAGFKRSVEKVPDLPQYDITGLEKFRKVAQNILKIENRTVENLPDSDNESVMIKKYYRADMQRQDAFLQKGYLFTAANEAFLNYIEVSTISSVFSGKVDLSSKRKSIKNCLESLPDIPKTKGNFEWIVGADLRKAWALDKLNTTDITKPKLLEEKYLVYNDLMYADAWCIVSGSLGQTAERSGEEINESAWKELAKKKMDEAEKIENIQPANEDHLFSAEISYSKGKYGAALYDAVFAIEMEKANGEMLNMSTNQLDIEVKNMLAENRTSMWGSVYQSQGAYLANVSARGSAFSILRYAKGLDNVTAQMRKEITPLEKKMSWADPLTLSAALSIFLIITFLLFYIRMRMARGSNGNASKTKRRRKVA